MRKVIARKTGTWFRAHAAALILAAAPGIALAQSSDAVERQDKGLINWSQGYVEAVGSGAPPETSRSPAQARLAAERAAKADAYRNLLETVKGVRVDSESVVESFMTTSDVIRTRVEGIVRGARLVGPPRYLSDGAVEVTMRMPMTGDLTQMMMEQVRGDVPRSGNRLPGFAPAPPSGSRPPSGMGTPPGGGGGSYEAILKDMQRKREEEERRRSEADADLRRIETERRAAEEARLAAERERKAEEERLRGLREEDERRASEARLAEQRRREEEERRHLAALETERRAAEAQRAQAEAEQKRLADQMARQQAQQQVAAASPSSGAAGGGAVASPPAAAGASSGAAAGAALAVTAMNARNERVVPDQPHPWTGLVIDARGLGLKPSLVPKVLAEDGTVLYGAQSLELDEAVRRGLVGYARDVPAAVKHLRVTDDPILLQALRAYGVKNSDVIIRAGDARVVTQTDPATGYLKKGRVMIVYN